MTFQEDNLERIGYDLASSSSQTTSGNTIDLPQLIEEPSWKNDVIAIQVAKKFGRQKAAKYMNAKGKQVAAWLGAWQAAREQEGAERLDVLAVIA